MKSQKTALRVELCHSGADNMLLTLITEARYLVPLEPTVELSTVQANESSLSIGEHAKGIQGRNKHSRLAFMICDLEHRSVTIKSWPRHKRLDKFREATLEAIMFKLRQR